MLTANPTVAACLLFLLPTKLVSNNYQTLELEDWGGAIVIRHHLTTKASAPHNFQKLDLLHELVLREEALLLEEV